MADNNRAREFAKLTETAADTAMGKLLRSFWQPVAVSKALAPKSAKAIRILGEDLTLYRGEFDRSQDAFRHPDDDNRESDRHRSPAMPACSGPRLHSNSDKPAGRISAA